MFNYLNLGMGIPPHILTDKIVPLRGFDNMSLSQNFMLFSTFLFKDVLDPLKLQNSLASLIERDGWNKLGGRLRLNQKKGNLEYHIPLKFTEDRPAIRFYNIKHDMAIATHPVACQLPHMKPSPRPTVLADPNTFQSLWHHPGISIKLSHYLERDEPQLGLVVVSFHDATIVTLSWPHTLFDALGKGELLNAWSLMLQGQPDKVLTPHGADYDPLADLGRHPTEPYKLEGALLSRLQLACCFFWMLFEALFYRYQTRVICIPAPYLRKLHQNALDGLPHKKQDDIKPFVSEGDVLAAWWARVYVKHSRNSNKLINLFNAFGLRATLAEDLLPSNRPYISNAVIMNSVLISSKDLLSQPLSYVAAQIRQRITESRSREQVEAYVALWRKSKKKIQPIFGSSTMRLLMNTNWSKAKLFDLDFSAAVVQRGNTMSACKPGFPSYMQCCFNETVRYNIVVILGKDFEGNYWLNGATDKAHWTRIEEAIAKDGGEQI